ncbi:hypothetical protein [Bacillus cereus]|uniref:hypothetical protein n=1 Tax=Bacillus cereus TaxID=1396 RepID=UPI0024BC12C1|nr:hypothetical protein [Bacillus cereus]
MNLDWVPYLILQDYLPNIRRSYADTIYKQIIDQYPKGEDWLNTPQSMKKSFRVGNYGDSAYILIWAWVRNLYNHPTYSKVLVDYIKSLKGSNIILKLARGLNLIDEETEKVIEDREATISSIIIVKKGIALRCLFLMKPFKQWTDDDVLNSEWISSAFSRKFTNVAVQDIRIRMGLSNTVMIARVKRHIWEKKHGKEFPDHRQMVLAFFNEAVIATPRKAQNVVWATNKLFDFLKENDLPDCSHFKKLDYIRFTNWLLNDLAKATVNKAIQDVRKFFQWGVGEYDFFPITLEFPEDVWKSLSKNARKEYESSSGHSFSEEGQANALAKAIIQYEPQNEKEDLIHKFWLIAISCPSRFNFIRNLPLNCLYLLPNSNNVYGLTSHTPDKAGNINGQFPTLDIIGVKAIQSLQERAERYSFKTIKNPTNNKEYVHLFQLTKYPWILDEGSIRDFLHNKIVPYVPEVQNEKSLGTHKLRTHILLELMKESKDITVLQNAAGHRSPSMTKQYLKSPLARKSLLYAIHQGYQKGELGGKFYLNILDLLSSEELSTNEVMQLLTTEMKFEQFLEKFGRRKEMGYCMSQKDCEHYLKCWSCPYFLFQKEEIESTISLLTKKIVNFCLMQKQSTDFSFKNPIVASSINAQALIIKRLKEVNLTEQQIFKMVEYQMLGKDIREVLKDEFTGKETS